jgi:hypothetical protein
VIRQAREVPVTADFFALDNTVYKFYTRLYVPFPSVCNSSNLKKVFGGKVIVVLREMNKYYPCNRQHVITSNMLSRAVKEG